MGRPRRDGTPARAVSRKKLSERTVQTTKVTGLTWGLALPGARAFRPSFGEASVEDHLSISRPPCVVPPRRCPVDRPG